MATLTGKTIKDTYKSLIKVNDNEELAATLQELTDGNGNGSGISINTTGDLKATGILEFGSLKDTGEDITIAKFVDEADGIGNNDNDTSIPTSAAVVDYVAAQITLEDLDFSGDAGTGSVDLDSQVFAIQGTANEIETLGGGQTLTIGLVDSPTVSGTITGGSITDGTAILTGGTLTGNLTGTVTGTSILADGVTATTQATSDDSTKVATTAYVKSVLTLEDLDFAGDSGTGSVDLDSQTFTIAGGTGLTSTASGQTLTVNIDNTVATLTGTQTLTNKTIDLTDNTISGTTTEFNTALSDNDFATQAGTETLTNKTIDADNNTISNLEVDNLKSGVLDTDLNTVSASDDTVASAKAIKTYVDAQVTAQDLDITDGTTTSAVDLDSQTMIIQGTTNEVEVGLVDQTFTVGLPDDVVIAGNLTVNGTTTTVNTETLSVKDPLIEMANDNAANTVDTGFYANYSLDAGVTTKFAGLFKDASDSDTFKLFKGLEVEPTTTVDTAGTGYSLADLDVAGLSASSGSISGDLIVDTNTLYVDSTNNRVGIGTTSPEAKLDVEGSSIFRDQLNIDPTGDPNNVLSLNARNSNDYANLIFRNSSGSANWAELVATTNTLAFETSGTERMRITSSGNVGIGTGTTSPARLLSIGDGTGSPNIQLLASTAGNSRIEFGDTDDSDAGEIQYVHGSSNYMQFTTNGEERLRIDSSGRVGIGVTPNPWSSPNFTVLQLGVGASIAGRGTAGTGDQIYISANTYYDGTTWRYIETNPASSYYQDNGDHVWRTAVNGAAGVPTTFSERMRIMNTGNVGIGTTNPLARLHVNGGSSTGFATVKHLELGFTSGRGLTISTSQVVAVDDLVTFDAPTATYGQMAFKTAGGERMRITSGGDISFRDTSNNEAFYWDASTARLGIGTTSPLVKTHISTTLSSGSIQDALLLSQNTGTSASGQGVKMFLSSSNSITRAAAIEAIAGSSNDHSLAFYTNAAFASPTEQMRITSGGRIHFYNLLGSSATQSDVRYDTTSKEMFYNTSSERYKTNITDLESSLEKINSLRTVRYQDIESEQYTTGLIAEEVIDVIPEVVFKKEIEGYDTPQPEGINYSDFAPFLIKAMQEQQGIINDLKARIETLENQ